MQVLHKDNSTTNTKSTWKDNSTTNTKSTWFYRFSYKFWQLIYHEEQIISVSDLKKEMVEKKVATNTKQKTWHDKIVRKLASALEESSKKQEYTPLMATAGIEPRKTLKVRFYTALEKFVRPKFLNFEYNKYIKNNYSNSNTNSSFKSPPNNPYGYGVPDNKPSFINWYLTVYCNSSAGVPFSDNTYSFFARAVIGTFLALSFAAFGSVLALAIFGVSPIAIAVAGFSAAGIAAVAMLANSATAFRDVWRLTGVAKIGVVADNSRAYANFNSLKQANLPQDDKDIETKASGFKLIAFVMLRLAHFIARNLIPQNYNARLSLALFLFASTGLFLTAMLGSLGFLPVLGIGFLSQVPFIASMVAILSLPISAIATTVAGAFIAGVAALAMGLLTNIVSQFLFKRETTRVVESDAPGEDVTIRVGQDSIQVFENAQQNVTGELYAFNNHANARLTIISDEYYKRNLKAKTTVQY